MNKRVESDITTKGVLPINWRLDTLPRDARAILHMRKLAAMRIIERGISGPVADLIAEQELVDTNPTLRGLHDKVSQPITFVLPTSILKFLARL